jgi:transcription antitermination factor NusB
MPKSNPKSAARLTAVQTLYSMMIDKEQNKNNALDAAFDILNKENVKIKKKFSEELLDLAISEKAAIEATIKKYLEKEKTIEGINPLLLAIVTIGVAELTTDKTTDRPILINEYLKITSEFFGKGETGFVNVILDKYVKESASAGASAGKRENTSTEH